MSGEYDKIVLYQHPISPPSMYCVMVFNYLGIDYINYEINVFKGEVKQPWYLKVNPNGAIPSIRDVNGFCTNEGIAITRYISNVLLSSLFIIHFS